MSRPTPDDFKDCVPSPTSTLCAQFKKVVLTLPVKLWQYIKALEGGTGSGGGTLAAIPRTGDLIFSAAPSAVIQGRLLCDGSEVAQASYPELYSAIGDTWGTASNPANFKLPDFRARFPVGAGSFAHQGTATLGTNGGSDQQTLTEANLPLYTPGHLLTNQLDGSGKNKPWNANAGTGDSVAGLGVGSAGPQTENAIELQDPSYGAENPTAVPIIPPFTPCYIYIVT